jgi:hypothetical protein
MWYAFMGITAYGFPFAALRRFVTIIALKTLKEFSEISSKSQTEVKVPVTTDEIASNKKNEGVKG